MTLMAYVWYDEIMYKDNYKDEQVLMTTIYIYIAYETNCSCGHLEWNCIELIYKISAKPSFITE